MSGSESRADDPLSGSEIDTLGDYVSARGRIEELRKMWKRSAAEVDNQCGYLDGKKALAIGRQIDAMTKLSRHIAKLLRI